MCNFLEEGVSERSTPRMSGGICKECGVCGLGASRKGPRYELEASQTGKEKVDEG